MKTERITVNKTPQQPQGIDIDLVVPESSFEERVIGFLMAGFLRDLKRENRIPYELPAQVKIDYTGKGTFLLTGQSTGGAFYEPPFPVALVGLRVAGNTFDLVHAEPKRATQPAQPAAAPSAEQAAPTEQPAPAESSAAPAEPKQGE